jgi:RimJ/RimL family protein N-acetyltransferase
MADNDSLRLRTATMSDARLLYIWRNDPATRAASHQQEPVRWDDHVAWLEKSLGDDSRKVLVAELDGKAVGTVRADLKLGTWELSWTVAPEFRGQGIASAMVRRFADSIVEPICAQVRVGNSASARVAFNAGLVFQSEASGIQHFLRPARTPPKIRTSDEH